MRVTSVWSTVSSRKSPPTFLHATLRQKWEGGACSNINFVSYNENVTTELVSRMCHA